MGQREAGRGGEGMNFLRASLFSFPIQSGKVVPTSISELPSENRNGPEVGPNRT